MKQGENPHVGCSGTIMEIIFKNHIMKVLGILFLCLNAIFVSCNHTDRKSVDIEINNDSLYTDQLGEKLEGKVNAVEMMKEKVFKNDTIIVKEKSAVFEWSNSFRLHSTKEKFGPNDWKEFTSNKFYYNEIVNKYLEKNKIPYRNIWENDIIIYHKSQRVAFEMLDSSVDNDFICWLFNPGRNPVPCVDKDIKDEFKKAFK